ncbi:MAG TPA: hypothetical protein VM052_01885, partial [Candidatus Limnocylindrales bacterium]|nr:hypothetical protein [Candidatus Limnocylindrales bacterium]
MATASASAPTSTGASATGLGSLSGNWTFFTRRVPVSIGARAQLEVWGIPPGGAPKLAFSYSVPLGGAPEAALDNNPYLRRQFSPDGRKIVVSTDVGLVVVDLASGSTSRVGVSGAFPSWSKDGANIAYLETVSKPDPPDRVPYERAIWVVPAAGGTARELANVGYSVVAPEWSPDGTLLFAQLKEGVGLIDVASGRELAGGRIPFALLTRGVHWRGAGEFPAIVAIVRLNDTQLVQYDARNRRFGFPAQWPRADDPSPCRCPKGMVPSDPRWNPTGTDEVVFKMLDENTQHTKAVIVDLRSGSSTNAVADVQEVTWSADGKQLIYIARSDSGGGAVRL